MSSKYILTRLTSSTRAGLTVLGIDPGLACTGWGMVRHEGAVFDYIDAGHVRSNAQTPLSVRLAGICEILENAAGSCSPDLAVIERVFVNVNFKSSLSLGHARGAALATLGRLGLDVVEIAPRAVKKNLTGDGLAPKTLVATFVRNVLRLNSSFRLSSDAMDALAIAIGYRSAGIKIRVRHTRRRARM